MSRRYCIGCIHWKFTQGESGNVYSTLTADPSIPADMACTKGHWQTLNLDEIRQSDIERAMEKADTCPDFSERPLPDLV